jgi:hypothetical protein
VASPFKLISGTIKDDKVHFNQVVYEKKPNAAGKFLVAIDPDQGMYVWLRTHEELLPHAKGGPTDYAKHLDAVDMSSPYLGPPVFVGKGSLSKGEWDDILGKNTGAKRKAVAKVFGLI